MIDESLALSERRPQVTELNRQLNEIADAGSVISPSHFLVGVIDYTVSRRLNLGL